MSLFFILIIIVLLFVGSIMVWSIFVVDNVIPVWFVFPFLLPAALLIDCFFSSDNTSSKFAKFSTTFSLIGLTFVGFLFVEFEEMRTATLIALGMVFFVPLIFAPEIILFLLGTIIGSIEDYRQKQR